MPLVTRIIQAAVPLPEYAAVAKDQSLAGDSAFEITHATSLMQLTRVVDQLSQLSTVAAEMFADIAAISGATSKRIQDLQTRVQKIKLLVPQMESRIQEAVVTNELPAERTEWRTTSSMSLNAFTKATANPTVTSVYYQTCEAPPDLNSLNSFRDDGKPCMMFYSYPEFFVEQWKILMIKEEEAIRKHRKAEKKQNRKNRKKLTKVRAVDVKRYNSTGELITSIAVDENAPVNQTSDMSSVKVSSQALHERPSISEPLDASPSPSIVPSPMSPWSDVSSPLDYHAGTAHRSAQKLPPFLDAVVPPPPPPAPPAALAPPPPPPPPLKVVTGSEAGPKRTQSQSDLLSSIRGGEFKLKKVDERLLTPKTPDAAAGNDVAHILMRRAALEMSDSEDDSGSDDEEWD